ncbi:MAG: hypothetical protein Q9191_003896 [Dirinaria sp. TL-2023a]
MTSSSPPPGPLSPEASFPVPPSAPSIISSRMTDIVSEDGDEYQPEGLATTHALNRKANDSSRPQSPTSAQTRPSRRGTPFSGTSNTSPGWRSGGAFGGPGGSISNTSRPQSANSRSSRTHVPSLASQAFFHPMSSQRLQAQRSNRAVVPQHRTPASLEGYSETESHNRRHSIGSHATDQHQDKEQPGKELSPPSRGTDFTKQDDRYTTNASPTGEATAQSIGESERPLQRPSASLRPVPLQVNDNYKHSTARGASVEKSPRSFRASFLLPARRSGVTSRTGGNGHRRLDSGSPRNGKIVTGEQDARKSGINYQYFDGNTVFCWGGRLQNTRDRPVNIATALIVILPSCLFFAYSAPWLWHNVSPAIPIFFAYFVFLCISSLIHASVTNPGILPRNLHPIVPPENSDDPLTLGPPTTEWTMVKSASKETAAMDVPSKYCKTCNIWRPLRCHHCRICDNCIETQDHHCVWINNCVGRRNYRYFFTFIFTGTILGIFLTFASLGHCLRYQSSHHVSFRESIDRWRVPFAMFIYGLLATPYPACLLAYHLFLMGRGDTTREYLNALKFLKKDRHRPYNQGSFWKNWLVVLLRPRPPTYLHFKAKYEEGDQRFGPRRGKRTAPLVDQQQGGAMELQKMENSTPGFEGPTALRQPGS